MTIQWARYYFHIKVRKTSSHTQDHKTERDVLCLKLIVRHSSPSDFYLSLMRSQFLFNSKYTNWITLGLILRLFILSSQSLSSRDELTNEMWAPHVVGDRVPFSCSQGTAPATHGELRSVQVPAGARTRSSSSRFEIRPPYEQIVIF